MPKRIGVFGGSFDPPHVAHMALAQTALAELQLDELRIIPTGQAWHKVRVLTPAPHRLCMAQLAFAPLSTWWLIRVRLCAQARVTPSIRCVSCSGKTRTLGDGVALGDARMSNPSPFIWTVSMPTWTRTSAPVSDLMPKTWPVFMATMIVPCRGDDGAVGGDDAEAVAHGAGGETLSGTWSSATSCPATGEPRVTVPAATVGAASSTSDVLDGGLIVLVGLLARAEEEGQGEGDGDGHGAADELHGE